MANLLIKRQRVFSDSGTMDCSCHNPQECTSQDSFERAWKAIADGNFSSLEQAIQEMKESDGGSSKPLDTCRLIEKCGVAYSMSLLSLCGFYERMEMADFLLMEGADMNAKCTCEIHTGTPVFQMMLHCLVQDKCDKLSVTMLQHFIEKGAELNGKITFRNVGLDQKDSGGVEYGMLDLPLSMQRIDCAKVLVKAGVDLISGGSPTGEELDVVPMFQEYRDHGTNEFICWAFNEYIPQHPEIDLKRIIQSIIIMKKKDEKSCYWQSVQRAPAHAILTSHHEETIKHLVQFGKECGLDLLDERSCTGKTALHVAAENNDVKSVQLLLQLGADTKASDNSDMNPFMLAVVKCCLEVVKAMMEKDPELVSSPMGSGTTVIHWALEQSHHCCSAFFKGWFEENPKALLAAKDSQGNTIAHLVAASGNTEVFEILWSNEFAEAVISNRNFKDKTPLQLAVEKGCVNILKTFKSCVDEGKKCTAPKWHRKLKKEWWSEVVPYFLYASSCGSLDAVKFFIESGQKPNIQYPSCDGKTPLLCAAEAGHDEIVAYLLQFRTVRTDLESESGTVKTVKKSSLLMAARNGHTRCVTLLLENGANVLQTDLKNRNYLMLAIQNHHKDTALAILSGKDGLKALKRDKSPTPLQLLINNMPDLAEYVLNKCITKEEPKQEIAIDGKNFVDSTSTDTADQPVHYNFEYLEDNVLDCMIEHNRLKLLQHQLVENLLSQKYRMMTLPLFRVNMLFYLIFLFTLNSFVLVVPRPEPDSETCPTSDDVTSKGSIASLFPCITWTSSEFKGNTVGQPGGYQIFLAATVFLLYFLSLLGLLVEVLQLIERRWKYFKDVDNYFQLALFSSTLIFIYGFDNHYWCSNIWQWQIGAVAVFLSWLNFIFILKYTPYVIAGPINMFLGICGTFLRLVYLPFVLISAFGVPFYMVFVRTNKEESLPAFRSPLHAIVKTLLQLAGEFDFEATFNQGDLLYTPTTYILFITFLITMPILFINLLNALAVGETQEIKENAELTTLKLRVVLIREQWGKKGMLLVLEKFRMRQLLERLLEQCGIKHYEQWDMHFKTKYSPNNSTDYAHHAKIAKELRKRNEEIYRTVMVHITPADAVRNDIAKLKEDMAKLMQHLKTIGGN